MASTEKEKMLRGELYLAFSPDLVKERNRCSRACAKYSSAADMTRRERVQAWRDVVGDTRPIPPEAASAEDDEALFEDDAWVEPPIHMDYGTNVKLGDGVFLNFNSVFVDTCPIQIGARTLVGPNCSFYSGTHPLDPAIRNGTKGPELGKPIDIGEDCWFGGDVKGLILSEPSLRSYVDRLIVLPGVKIGRGCTIGAGSVVTKDVPDFHVAAGNPAKIIRKIETSMDPSQAPKSNRDAATGAEEPMAKAD